MHAISYLLCELKSRDLDSRALIAAYLLKAGISVVVGQRWAIGSNRYNSPKGCYLFPTANQIQGGGMMQVRDAGHKVIASDEEALPLVDSLVNVAPNSVEACHKFVVDSDAHARLLSSQYLNFADKFIVTGSPRIETLRGSKFEPQNETPYLLFNTGFAIVNSIWGNLRTAITTLLNGADLSEEEVLFRIKVENSSLECMRALITQLAPDHRIVIRPHPAEQAQSWRDSFPEAEVVEGSSSLSWILGAKAVFHANSTTGLEAAVANVPTINLDLDSTWGDRFTMKQVNHTVQSAEGAAKLLQSLLNGTLPPPDRTLVESLFPPDGAQNTAKAIMHMIDRAPPISGEFKWQQIERTDIQRTKFTVSLQDLKNSLKFAESICGPIVCKIHQLDDSVFLLTP